MLWLTCSIIIQVRVDASKLVVQSRRPRPQAASGIGLYGKIMEMLCFFAILMNSLLLGLTSSSMGQLFALFQWNVGQDLTETWRYNVCSPDAKVRSPMLLRQQAGCMVGVGREVGDE